MNEIASSQIPSSKVWPVFGELMRVWFKPLPHRPAWPGDAAVSNIDLGGCLPCLAQFRSVSGDIGRRFAEFCQIRPSRAEFAMLWAE